MPSLPSMLITVCIVMLVSLLILDWFFQSEKQRAKSLRAYGWSQRKIADQLNTKVCKVRKYLAS